MHGLPATFVVEEVIYQNMKKKVKKIIPLCCNRHRRKRGLKTGIFFKIDIFHIENFQKICPRIFFTFKDIKRYFKKQSF
jgi:hypothetical protein